MKTLGKLILGLSLAGTLLTSCAGEYYVSSRPVEPYYEQGVAPYADAYWIPGEWVWTGGRYVYTRGYWTHARRGHAYVRGYWRQGPRGHSWVRGHWR